MSHAVPIIPQGLDSWEELNRRCNSLSLLVAEIHHDLDNLKDILLLQYSIAAYGQMRLATPPSAFSITGTFTDVDDYDTVGLNGGKGVTMNATTGRFSVAQDSIYFIHLMGTILHDELNAGRSLEIRIYNHTAAAAGPTQVIGTGRNVGSTAINVTLMFEVAEANKNDDYAGQIRSDDTYLLPEWETLNIGIHAVGEWRDVLEVVAP